MTTNASRLRILVSNDDGVLAPGIALLAELCATVGQVTVVAPDREQSGTSHSLTLHRPLRAHRRSDGAFQVDGTPTDCVLLALGALMPDEPHWVFSGVNHGPNMGEDVLYSGTVAAAMEAVSLGVPGVAISFAGGDPAVMAFLKARIDGNLAIVDKRLDGRAFILGNRPTIADLSLCGYLYYPAEEFGFDIAGSHKNIAAWLDRIKVLPGWKHPYELMPGYPPQL